MRTVGAAGLARAGGARGGLAMAVAPRRPLLVHGELDRRFFWRPGLWRGGCGGVRTGTSGHAGIYMIVWKLRRGARDPHPVPQPEARAHSGTRTLIWVGTYPPRPARLHCAAPGGLSLRRTGMCAASRGGGVWGYVVFESGGRYLDDRAAIGGGPRAGSRRCGRHLREPPKAWWELGGSASRRIWG